MVCTRIYIKVTEPSVWQKLMNIEIDEGLGIYMTAVEFFGEPFDSNSTELLLDGDWSADSDSLEEFVRAIKEAAGDNCVVISDFTDIEEDPFNCCFAAVDRTYNEYIDGEMHFEVNVNNVKNWLEMAGIELTEEMLKYLAKFDGDNFEFARK